MLRSICELLWKWQVLGQNSSSPAAASVNPLGRHKKMWSDKWLTASALTLEISLLLVRLCFLTFSQLTLWTADIAGYSSTSFCILLRARYSFYVEQNFTILEG